MQQDFDVVFWVQAGALLLTGMLAACSYPAIALTRLAPIEALRGQTNSFFTGLHSSGLLLRKSLVVFQFACSAILIFGLTVINRQLNFLQDHDKGLSLDQILVLKMPDADWQQDSINRIRMSAFKNQVTQIPGVGAITASSVVPGLGIQSISGTSGGIVLANQPGKIIAGTIYFLDTEPDFYSTFGIRFLAGKPFVATDERTANEHIIINEALLKMLGIQSAEAAIGKELAYAGGTGNYRMKIEGVVTNFHIESLKEPARPTVYFCQPNVRTGYISIKPNKTQLQPLLV